MEYNELLKIYQDQINNGGSLRLDENIAKQYLGQELITQIEDLLDLANQNNCRVYTHGTIGNVKSIINEGFHFEHRHSDKETFDENNAFKWVKSPEDIINNKEVTTFYGDPALKVQIVEKEQNHQNPLFAETSKFYQNQPLEQKFCGGLGGGYSTIVARVIPHNDTVPCTEIAFAIIPKEAKQISKDYFYITAETNDFSDDPNEKYLNYYESSDIDKECFIGYLDVRNKKFIINESFDMNHLLNKDKQLNNQSFDGMFDK